MRLCTLHNYYAPVWLPYGYRKVMRLCTPAIIMHPYGGRKVMGLCTMHNYYASYGYRKVMTLCTLHNYDAPVWLPESDEIMHPA